MNHDKVLDKLLVKYSYVSLTKSEICELLSEFVDLIAPNHERTSCTDDESNGNEYFNEFGSPRCTRCCLRSLVEKRQFPHSTFPVRTSILLGGHERITESIYWTPPDSTEESDE